MNPVFYQVSKITWSLIRGLKYFYQSLINEVFQEKFMQKLFNRDLS